MAHVVWYRRHHTCVHRQIESVVHVDLFTPHPSKAMPSPQRVCIALQWFFILLIAPRDVVAQPADTSYAVLDRVFVQIQERALNRDGADWPRIRAAFDDSVEQASSFVVALEAFRAVFEALDDVHSSVSYSGHYIAYSHGVSDSVAKRVQPLLARAWERNGQVSSMLLGDGVGYLFVPAFQIGGADAIQEATDRVRGAVCRLAADTTRGWIIDLRLNTGGNVYPMLSGLGDVLGDGVVAHAVEADGEPFMPWAIREGVLFLGDYPTARAERRCPDAAGRKVAVLVGPATVSSGQATAIAFAGWDRARLFGEPTAEGYATVNQWYQITPELVLNLSELYLADRSGFAHRGIVLPDEYVFVQEHFEAPDEDPLVRHAVRWILGGK